MRFYFFAGYPRPPPPSPAILRFRAVVCHPSHICQHTSVSTCLYQIYAYQLVSGDFLDCLTPLLLYRQPHTPLYRQSRCRGCLTLRFIDSLAAGVAPLAGWLLRVAGAAHGDSLDCLARGGSLDCRGLGGGAAWAAAAVSWQVRRLVTH